MSQKNSVWRMKSGDLVEAKKPYFYNVETGEAVWQLPPQAKRERDRLLAYLENIKLFKVLDFTQLNEIADTLTPMHFPKNTTIIKEGDEGNTFFLVEQGTVDVFKGDSFVVSLKEGSFFGEQALLTKSTRNATVKTSKDKSATCLVMNRKHFEALLGPLTSVMKSVNAKREALRRQKNASERLRKRIKHLEKRFNPKLAAELEVQKIADHMQISNSAAEAMFRTREEKRLSMSRTTSNRSQNNDLQEFETMNEDDLSMANTPLHKLAHLWEAKWDHIARFLTNRHMQFSKLEIQAVIGKHSGNLAQADMELETLAMISEIKAQGKESAHALETESARRHQILAVKLGLERCKKKKKISKRPTHGHPSVPGVTGDIVDLHRQTSLTSIIKQHQLLKKTLKQSARVKEQLNKGASMPHGAHHVQSAKKQIEIRRSSGGPLVVVPPLGETDTGNNTKLTMQNSLNQEQKNSQNPTSIKMAALELKDFLKVESPQLDDLQCCNNYKDEEQSSDSEQKLQQKVGTNILVPANVKKESHPVPVTTSYDKSIPIIEIKNQSPQSSKTGQNGNICDHEEYYVITVGDWEIHTDPSNGCDYFVNKSINKTTWDIPNDVETALKHLEEEEAAIAKCTLPGGWTIERDQATGMQYFANANSGESTWELPSKLQNFDEVAKMRQILFEDPKKCWAKLWIEGHSLNASNLRESGQHMNTYYFFNLVTHETKWCIDDEEICTMQERNDGLISMTPEDQWIKGPMRSNQS